MTDEQIIEDLRFTSADQTIKDRVVENVRTIVELRVIGIITDMMTDEQEATFNQLQEQGDNAAVWEWLKNDIVGVDVSEVYEATLKDYLEYRKANEFDPTPAQ